MGYTEGKWLRLRDSCVIAEGKLNDGFVISDCYGPDQEGNSHLIACAPALLEALEGYEKYVTTIAESNDMQEKMIAYLDFSLIRQKAKAAIAAARGTV